MIFIDTHTHIDGPEFDDDRDVVIQRAKDAGAEKLLIPAIDLKSMDTVLDTCNKYNGYAFPMVGLHPEEVKADYKDVLSKLHHYLEEDYKFIAIGEIGLDYYWSREFENEQLDAFETQIRWSIETGLPVSIHCRKAQNEMIKILKKYKKELPGGVFHCFTGNEKEAAELLDFDNFVLGIGGVITFKKSHLPEVVKDIPLERIVLETDAPYMAPAPMRGNRNESSYIPYIIEKIALAKGITMDDVAKQTTENAERVFFSKNH